MKSKKATVAKVKAAPKSSSMELPEIEKLIKFVQNSGVSEVSLEQKDFKITIKTTHGAMMMPTQLSPVQHIMHAPSHAPSIPHAAPAATTAKGVPVSAEDSKYVTIKSPMIGTFYRSSTPEKPVFTNVGDEIKPGKVLCIIEAMKLFN